jgi:cell division septation protein DedD
MISSQRKKRLYLAVGLMILLILGLLWHAGMIMQGSRTARKDARRPDAKALAMQPQPVVVTKKISASVPGEAHAAEGQPSAVVRKKLPPMPPQAPKAEPQPAAPAAASEPAAVAQEQPKEPPAPETAPAVAVVPPAPEAPKGVPEKPIEAKPAEPSPSATAPAASMPASPPVPPPAPPMAQVAPAPPKKPEPAKTAAMAATSERSAYPFSLLLSSNRGRENALATLADYQRKGLAPHIVYTDLGEKGMWWRTLIGSYRSLEDALQAIKALKLSDAAVVKTPFANLVGDYPSEGEAAESAARLSRKGVFPYVVKGAGGTAQVLIGAFPTQAAAEQQQRELEGMGVAARTIRR